MESNPADTDYGELIPIVQGLDAVLAANMSFELRTLKIPAVMRRQLQVDVDPASGRETVVDTGCFEILVPEQFEEISHEVLDVTHLRREGDATTKEILAGFDEDEDGDGDEDSESDASERDGSMAGSLDGSMAGAMAGSPYRSKGGLEQGRVQKLISLVVLSIGIATIVWTIILSVL